MKVKLLLTIIKQYSMKKDIVQSQNLLNICGLQLSLYGDFIQPLVDSLKWKL